MSANDQFTDPLLDDPATREADSKAVMDSVIRRTPLDPEVARRVEERARRIREEILRRHGVLNVAVDLIREVRDEE